MLIFALLLILGLANSCWKTPPGGSESKDENAIWMRMPLQEQDTSTRLSKSMDSPYTGKNAQIGRIGK